MTNTTTHNLSEHASQNAHHEADARTLFGFWVYIMSDCILFASLFATYAVLHNSTFGGPNAKELFNLHFVLIETLILLTSSFTYGLAMLSAHHHKKPRALLFLAITFILGITFVSLEVNEFTHLISEGNGPDKSAFLSAFFTLVGTHGLHVTVGLMWMFTLMAQVLDKGLTYMTMRKLATLGLFWHFLDIIWIFVFSIVYLMGAL